MYSLVFTAKGSLFEKLPFVFIIFIIPLAVRKLEVGLSSSFQEHTPEWG
jgi:hypothetical protein